MLKVYCYSKCSTCRNALGWLRGQGIRFEERPIRETPPAVAELRRVLDAYGGNLRRLFNTSSADYREAGIKEQLAAMTVDEALQLLASHGNLVRRPLVVGDGVALAGFREEEWKRALG